MTRLRKELRFRGVLSLRRLIEALSAGGTGPGALESCHADELKQLVSEAPELMHPVTDPEVIKTHGDLVHRLMTLIFPPLYWDSQAFAALIPFSMEPFFVSPRFEKLFFDENGSFVPKRNVSEHDFQRGRLIRAYLMVLDKYYGIRQDFGYPLVHTARDPVTGLERYFRMNLDFRFAEAHAVTSPRAISDGERAEILEHITEPEVLAGILPPEDFEIHGFTVLHAVDVTESEVLAALEGDLVDQESIISRVGFERLQQRLRTLFRRTDLVARLSAVQQDQVLLLNSGCELARNCIFADSRHVPLKELAGTVFERVLHGEEVLSIPDILEETWPARIREEIVQTGVRSLLVAPLYYQGECIGTLELKSPRAGDLGPMDALVLKQLQPIFTMGIKRALDDLDNRVQGIIKQECTAVHPTVEWRFRQAAFRHLEDLQQGKPSEMEPIVFKNVYPIYGVSDIRGSTHVRNSAIQKDLATHLNLALDIVRHAGEVRDLLIFQELAGRIEEHLARIGAGLGTGDELAVVKFLREEVESVFAHLSGFGAGVARAIEAYEKAIDPATGTVYRLRKDFEDSVALLNEKLSAYLDQEEETLQAAFPHYYERHRTDGVDYLIYAGASLTEEGEFSDLYLKNLRLWQLKVTCGMARLAEGMKSSLKVPLDVANLILVQNTPLSIRFRFDEKRFDVDGAYDIRHEIIKSRVDKAKVRGTQERLTQTGKIAIVYSHPEEEKEMRRHVRFLQKEGDLTSSVERLELADLPGVRGLRALRVGVALEAEPRLAISGGVAV